MKKLIVIALICCLTTSSAQSSDLVTALFSPALVTTAETSGQYQYPGAKSYQVGPDLTLPGLEYLVRLASGESTAMLSAETLLDESVLANFTDSDLPTSAEGRYQTIEASQPDKDSPGRASVYLGDNLIVGDITYAQIILFPVILNLEREIKAVREISIEIGDRRITESELLEPATIYEAKQSGQSLSPLATGVEFLVVTGRSLEALFQEFVDYKNAIGITTELVFIEDILASYSGRDDAERLRERLKQFYTDGGRFVLLGGDETVVPIRYAYHYRTSTDLNLDYLQVCDLYFADVEGDWNADGDNVWGERYDDDANLSEELMVGRLPLSDPTEVSNYINKLIAYETDPGGGNLDWLTRAYFFSSDQMRDYMGTGQHIQIAAGYPAWFEMDTINGVENASGRDAAPTNALPSETVEELSNGYGIVNIIAHGRGDGFVVKSSEYNLWPKSYLLTAAQEGSHGSTDSLEANGLTSFYYSLACDNGGFDLERTYQYSSPGLARSLLGQAEAGAVGFIAYSRWGWVGSSHLLQRDYFDSLFANPDRPAIEAFYAVKNQYYYLRDLALGQNYYGDPTMKVYTDRPAQTEIAVVKSGASFKAVVTADGSPIANSIVYLSQNGSVIAEYSTDSQGEVLLTALVSPEETYQIAVVEPGHVVGYYDFVPSIVTGIDDDDLALPGSFRLGQNYPNPFNPTTTIPFEIKHAGQVSLTLFNILGQEIVTLIDQLLPVGNHEIEWDGRDHTDEKVASGLYLYRLTTESSSAVRKMLLIE